ncbi:AAA/ superfamily protein [Bifidobacterium saguini DSM 23967]|uniref:AAA/ superfamily protein n=2 Tax=Bifidobacterium saguini TaxID=762210 RepID=A0A087DED4_9BIFI|nr:ATP-binding protein [Bifidobacterium saguini]KFI93884.1 AAA/ superfamily protein [Bifidobacterium saguini DSM 23967]
MNYIEREQLISVLYRHRDTQSVKVLTGVRRCGKSTLLRHYADKLLADGVPERNIFVKRFDSFDMPLGYSAEQLYRDLRNAAETSESGTFYVMLDEIQEVDGWEKVVRRLQTREHTDVYITGSNAYLLSGELATYLAGRYVEVPVYPLSFREYASYVAQRSIRESQDQSFARYMMFGGMPGLYSDGAPEDLNQTKAQEILSAIYESVVIKDVATRYGIRDLATLEKLSRYLFATSGNLFSTNKVVGTLKSAGIGITNLTADNQIDALEKAFIIYGCEQSRLRGKELLRPQRKYYPVDNGFRNLAHGFDGSDQGAQLEGIVYMELRRRGYSVSIGTLPDGEIDFVARRGSEKIYIQVTLNMTDENTRARELAPLQKLNDAFPRMVLTLDHFGLGVTDEGITIRNVVDWLLK